jgi:hypothetical protein
MSRRQRRLLLGCAALLALILPVFQYLNRSDPAHQSIQVWLRYYSAAIYEYHSKTGQWPSQIDDIAKTSLPLRLRYWRQMVDDGTIVIVWHKHLKSEPKDNASQILAYHNKGVYARLGRVWVCWGDLRTEYIRKAALGVYPKVVDEELRRAAYPW